MMYFKICRKALYLPPMNSIMYSVQNISCDSSFYKSCHLRGKEVYTWACYGFKLMCTIEALYLT